MIKKNFIEITVLAGIVGFIYASLLLTCNCKTDKTTFKQQVLETTPVVSSILAERDTIIRIKRDTLQAWLKRNTKIKNTVPYIDSMKRQNTLNQALTAIRYDTYQFENTNKDTSLMYWQAYFSINRNTLEAVLESNDKNKSIPVQIIDTSSLRGKHPENLTANKTIKVSTKGSRPVDFFKQYTNFGFWFVVSVTQVVLWLLLIVLLMAGSFELHSKLKDLNFNITLSDLLIKILLASLFILAFVCILYFYLIGENVINDSYFMNCFNLRMGLYAIPGYLLAAICFGAFLFWARQLDKLNETVTTSENSNITYLGNEDNKQKYELLKTGFTRSFGAAAMVLSAFVFWMGLLFQSINGMDIMVMYEKLSGKKFLPYDFVYLVAIMHTVLLLIFYIPAKLKFDSLKISQDTKSANADVNSSAFKKFFSAISDSFLSMIIAASPLLTSLLQKLVESFLK